MPIDTYCPTCTKRVSIEDDLAGQQVECPHCGKFFTQGQGRSGGDFLVECPGCTHRFLAGAGLEGQGVTCSVCEAKYVVSRHAWSRPKQYGTFIATLAGLGLVLAFGGALLGAVTALANLAAGASIIALSVACGMGCAALIVLFEIRDLLAEMRSFDRRP